ncbi:MAG: hypothetical protein J6T70_02580 [Bacteroidales bacterium]|nr:hypothetical protein [Bacteroidales bacterium]
MKTTTLDPKHNRLNYGGLLSPDSGFMLQKAVCTTYSLDLQTLVASTMSLALGEATDSELAKNPINLLSALQKVTDKMFVFCDASQIYAVNEKKRNRFLGLLEKTIVPVSLKSKSESQSHPSFHPKCWILQYGDISNPKIHKYRLLVMSRNLTFDRSWDVTVCLDGSENPASQTNPQTQRLIGFVEFLKQQSSLTSSFLDELISDLKRVKFEIDDSKFSYFEILPIGVGVMDINNSELFTKTASSICVMSPFISKSLIDRLMCRLNNYYGQKLITRESELYKIKKLPRYFSVFCLKDEIIDYELNNSECDGKQEDIHAKIYIAHYSSDVNCIYLGSMNASESAVNRNVELMVKLVANDYTTQQFSDELRLWDSNGNFKEIYFDNQNYDAPNDKKADMENVAKKLSRLEMCAVVTDNENGYYDVEITIANCEDMGMQLTISPFFAKGIVKPIAHKIFFNNLTISQLSEFYTLIVSDGENIIERTIKIPTVGMPEEREKNIVTSIISNKKKLSEYIAFILGDDTLGSFAEDVAELIDGEINEASVNKNNNDGDELIPVYERMLKTSVSNPDRIKEIESVIQMVDDEKIVTPEFKKMYQTFKSALKL